MFFFLGVVLLLVVTPAFGLGAVRYEFSYAGTVEDPTDARWMFDYEDLTAEDKEVVQRAMEGERFVFQSDGLWPGPGRGDLALRHQNEWHMFDRRIYFGAKTLFGIASIASTLAGFASIVESVRRKIGA
ncbi:hypothetical protein [Haloarchaeobius sp. FL176]|uniref:hypothetical protein n=1 Tax=Haloarchaeobius sp. FL176 TaxID=2967129 RepID=UPI0021472A63|nr:hypothetical protein [Haloarchaeobius sp. FL176]